MDKIKVNNQVVSMRKFVKQAKIHAINKCTKQIKLLENRKGNEEQMAKTKRKHQRLLEEVTILKRIKPDSVSKLALLKTKDWKTVLSEKNVSLEERCFAMLANHPPVQKAVEKFHNDNSELIAKIPELIKEWEEKKSKSSQINKKKQKGKQSNPNDPNTLPIGKKSNASLKNVPNSANLKSIQSNITEQTLTVKEATKRKVSSDNLDSSKVLNDPTEDQFLVEDYPRSDASGDDSLSGNSDLTNHQNRQIKEELPVEAKRKSYQFHKNLKQFKACPINNETNLAKKKVPLRKEAVDSDSSNEANVESNKEENTAKSHDIRSKLLEISMSKTKLQNKPGNKTSTVYQQSKAETDSDDEVSINTDEKLNVNNAKTKKPEVKNKIKAVTMLDLNELQDVDEIPIGKSDSDAEDETDEDSGEQKKDPFFLHDGEPVSESDNDENAEKEIGRRRDFPPFKKTPYGNFRDKKDDSFQKRKFQKHSVNGKNSNFRENRFMKNRKEFSFKDKRNSKRSFDNDNADFRQNKNFKFASKDKFSNRNGANNFKKNPKDKSFSQNHSRDAKRSSYPPKPNQSNSLKINKADDKPLHPSWEAKRKLKEAATMKFQGKRMVFNE